MMGLPCDVEDTIIGYQKLIESHQKYIDEYQKRIAELRQQKG
jgi:hypothetical protein